MNNTNELKEKDGVKYILTPVAELVEGDIVVTWNQDGEIHMRRVVSITEGGAAYYSGTCIKGYTIEYDDTGWQADGTTFIDHTTAGKHARAAKLVQACCYIRHGKHEEHFTNQPIECDNGCGSATDDPEGEGYKNVSPVGWCCKPCQALINRDAC